MKHCREIEKIIIKSIHDLLTPDQEKSLKEHLKTCSHCQAVYQQYKTARDTFQKTSQTFELPDHFEQIIHRKEVQEQTAFKKTMFSNWLNSLRRSPRQIALGTASLMIIFILSFFLLFKQQYSSLQIIQASGQVQINQKVPFQNNIFNYKLTDQIDIRLDNGKCDFQLDADKYISLHPDTHIQVSCTSNITIRLVKGILIGKVDKAGLEKTLIIQDNNIKFEIIGTVFLVHSTEDYTELEVDRGKVKCSFNNNTYCISNREKIRIHKNKLLFKKQVLAQNKLFDQVKTQTIHQDPRQLPTILIQSSQPGSRVYGQDQYLGDAPLYLSGKEKYQELFITKEGFISQEIDIQDKKNNSFYINLMKQYLKEQKFQIGSNNPVIQRILLIHNRLIMADWDGIIYQFDPQTEKTVWTFHSGSGISSYPYHYQNHLYLAFNNHQLYKLDSSGHIIWKTKTGILIDSTPQYYQKKIYICNNKGYLVCLDDQTGRLEWQIKLEHGFLSSPSIADDILYIGGLSGRIYAVDLNTRKLKWSYQTQDKIVDSQPLLTDDKVILGSNDKHLYALQQDNGQLVWKINADDKIYSSAVKMADNVIICTVNGKVISVMINNGQKRWEYETNKKIEQTPFVYKDKYLGIITENRIYIMNKWGLLFTDYPVPANTSVFKDKHFYYYSQDNYLHHILLDWLN